MSAQTTPYPELWRVAKRFSKPDGSETVVVSDFSMHVGSSEFVSLIGHSGCGKSTILSIVAGLTEASSGGIILADREIEGPGPDRGVVFQSPCLLPWLTALENVLLGVREVNAGKSKQEAKSIARHYLELVGLVDSLHKRPAELSQGMRQRVGIARAFALNPKMLLLDEPFGMLDSLTRYELQQLLMDVWARDQKTALMVTHDVDEALLLSDRIVMMTTGPNARVGEVLTVPFERPRNRVALQELPEYEHLRERMLSFLASQDRHSQHQTAEAKSESQDVSAAIVPKAAAIL